MEEIIKRCGINPCSQYSQKSDGRYCFNGYSAIKVTKGNPCYLEHKVKSKKPEQTPQPTTHPFGEWGKEPLPFP